MKKKLEADLISIAHRILKLKNKSELVQLHQETQKLYEKLSVLLFVEENFGEVKPTIGYSEIEKKVEEAFESSVEVVNEEVVQPEIEATLESLVESKESKVADEIGEETSVDVSESVKEEAQEIQEEVVAEVSEEKTAAPIEAKETGFKPAFELAFEAKIENVKEEVKEEIKEEVKEEEKAEVKEEDKSKDSQISFEDILGADYIDPVFVKPEELRQEELKPENVIPIGRDLSDTSQVISINKTEDYKTVSLNERLSKGIVIGLNDRIAFMKHLFANSSEDYNRVLNQLITFDTFEEAQSFINNMVKPDYNNWEGKDEYAERFIEILEKRFS